MTFEIIYNSEDLARLTRALHNMKSEHLVQPMYLAIGKDITGKAGVYPTWCDSPPYPYYIRGRGMQYSSGYNDKRSEMLHTKWYQTAYPDYLKMGNTASYAGYVHGPEQTAVHKSHGWLKLFDVAVKELPGVIKKLEARALKLWNETR